VTAPTIEASPTTLPTAAALDASARESGHGGAVGVALAAVTAVVLLAGAAWWALRRRFSAA
jgi:hypothetical protein